MLQIKRHKLPAELNFELISAIGELNTAVDRLFHVVEHFPGKKLLIMFKRIARHFKVDWFIGYEDMKLFKHYTFTMFCFQIDKIQKGVATHCDSAIDDAAAYFDLAADEHDASLF
uniref:DUF1016 family protein n=1 Tax=Globodera pallida TaxID=36090 RepID=A0A183BRF8_GLOPA